MARFQPGNCAYCGHEFKYATARQRRISLPPRAETADHVYPVKFDIPNGLPRDALLNKLRCCNTCNAQKANMHPVRWLTFIDNERRRREFAELLLQLGEDPKKVARALERTNVHPRISKTE